MTSSEFAIGDAEIEKLKDQVLQDYDAFAVSMKSEKDTGHALKD